LLGCSALVLIGIYYYMALPRVVISAPVGSRVAIRSLGNSTGSQYTTSQPVTTYRIHAGNYLLRIISTDRVQAFYGSASLFQHTSYQLTVDKAPHGMAVSNTTAYNAFRDASGAIVYLDTTDRTIKRIVSGGSPVALQPAATTITNTPFQNQVTGLYPIAGGRAIVDADSLLYLIDNGVVVPLNMGDMSAANIMAVATNPTQGSFVVAAGDTLYWYTSAAARPQALLTYAKHVDKLAYGGDTVLAYSTRMPPANEDIRADYAAYAIDPIIANIQTKTLQNFVTGPIVDASIAPDGQHAFITGQGGNTTAALYDLKSGKILYQLESPETLTPPWIDSSHFIYGKGSSVWKFDINRHNAVAVGTFNQGWQPTSATYDAVSQAYLVTTYPSAAEAAIYRFGAP
jgi:hypothetical protein